VGVVALACSAALAGFLTQPWRSWFPGLAGPRITRLAVLPLTTLSSDAEQEYFADGMTDILIADLTQISALRVISRTSVMLFKGAKKPLPEIARQLGVDDIVTATVLKSGGRVRITAELVDGRTDQHLWANSYEHELSDVLTLQGEVARAIADEVRARVTPQEAGRLARSRTVAPAAFEAYLKGRYYYGQFNEEAFLKSIEYFEEAIRLDPKYADPYAGLVDDWYGLHRIGARSFEETLPKTAEAAEKALALDDTLSSAHSAMSDVHLDNRDLKGAEAELQKAIALDPGSSLAHLFYSSLLRYSGRADEGIAESKRALELDPLAMLTNQGVGNAYLSARRYDLAIAHYQKTLELYPNDSSVIYLLGWSYVFRGMYDKGIEQIAKSHALDGLPPELDPDLAYIHAVTGKKEEARHTLARLLDLAKTAPLQAGLVALIYIGLDDREQALAWLEKAYEQHSQMMFWLKTDPRFDKIRPDPRFQDLMRRAGFR
jgi:adenylate cyclase